MERQIICLAIRSFEVALARLTDPALRTRPLAIAPLSTSRALLRELSVEAMQAGLDVGMPVEHARRLCPSLHVLSPNPHRVHRANLSLLSVIARYAPVWEPFHAVSFVMDLTGTTKLFGSACDVAAKAQQDILKHYHLDGVAGVGSNKLVAQTAATLVGPSELCDVRHGSEGVFMSPLSVGTLPGLHRPCMRKILERLDDLNILTLGDVAESPLDARSTGRSVEGAPASSEGSPLVKSKTGSCGRFPSPAIRMQRNNNRLTRVCASDPILLYRSN